MTPSQPDDANRNPLDAYADGDPDAVRAARPPEPSEAEWEAVRRRIHARLDRAREPAPRRRAVWLAAVAVASAAAAAVVWVAVALNAPQREPNAPEVAEVKPLPVAPLPHEPQPDPLAEFAVLPMATADEVVLHRVPGNGWLPVGEHPLPGTLSLATPDEVELDDPDAVWTNVTPAPGYAPMIFATKPR